MTKFRINNTQDDAADDLATAAYNMLWAISNMTTEEFSRGADRDARRALATALGLDPDDYSL